MSQLAPSDISRDNYVQADGIETHYLEIGEGPPILMIHGGGSGADAWGNWRFSMPRLAEEGFRVLALDMVGWGRTEQPDPEGFDYTNENRIAHIADYIRQLELESPTLVGNSMGGAASMGVAMQHPELLGRLVLVGTAGYMTVDERAQVHQDAIATLRSFAGGRDEMREIVNLLSARRDFDVEEMVDHRLENYHQPGTDPAQAARTGADMYYDDEDFEEIDVDTLLIHGKDDLVIPPESSLGICKLVDGASLYVLADCGHWIMVDQADLATTLTVDFIRRRAG